MALLAQLLISCVVVDDQLVVFRARKQCLWLPFYRNSSVGRRLRALGHFLGAACQAQTSLPAKNLCRDHPEP